MEYVGLGDTGQLVSRVGYGCAAIDGYDYGTVDDRDSENAIRTALELGITFFDTADVYGLGHAERVLSRALGSRRHGVFVSTKFGVAWDERGGTWRDTSPARASVALHESLRRLRLECIPLYQIHWPDGTTPISDTLAALLRHQQEGKIGAIGICNVAPHFVEEALTSCRIQSLQVPFSLLERDEEGEIEQCRSRFGISVVTYNSLAQGLLTGKYGRSSTFSGTDVRRRSQLFTSDARERGLRIVERLQIVGRRHGRTPAQVALRWILEHRTVSVALTGAKTVSQITENAGGSDWSLPPEDVAFLQAPLSIPCRAALADSS